MELDRWGALVGAGVGGAVSLMIVLGSRNLRYFDVALLPYALAVIFSAAASAYRYAVWLQRPPTWQYWRQSWRLFWQGGPLRNTVRLVGLLGENFAAQRFIGQRSRLRWVMHLCLSWGTLLAFALTFPLVFGWIHFETLAEDLHTYQVYVFGVKVTELVVDSLGAFFAFNLLNFSALLVLIGIALSVYRRLSEPGALTVQQFGNDVLPLLLLCAVATTGLGLTVSARWFAGHGFATIAFAHTVAVIAMLLYLPFGKFFHIFQRPAQLGVAFYKRAAQSGPQAVCHRCHQPFAAQVQIADLKQVLAGLQLDYHLDGPIGHYQDICPPCRRKLLALNQGRTMYGPQRQPGELLSREARGSGMDGTLSPTMPRNVLGHDHATREESHGTSSVA